MSTGLETVVTLPVVAEYLAANSIKPGTLMPGWEGWDTPHLLDMRRGGVVPTSPEMLRERAAAWKQQNSQGRTRQ